MNDFQGGKIDDIHHKRLFELLKGYFVVGGMPEVVTLYVENREQPLNAFRAVRQLQRQFVLEIDGDIIPVEVKSGVNTKSKSLQAYIQKYNPTYAIKFTGNKFGLDKQKRIYNYPLYMISNYPKLSTQR